MTAGGGRIHRTDVFGRKHWSGGVNHEIVHSDPGRPDASDSNPKIK
jgi:hypothetical protein